MKSKLPTFQYLAVMLFASGISMGRGFLLAAVLDPLHFGTYALVVSSGTFFSLLLSSGLVEFTLKNYPRMWAQSRAFEVLLDADTKLRSITLRAIALSIATTTAFAFFDLGTALGFLAGCVAMSMTSSALFASVNRATTSVSLVATSALMRASVALAFAGTGAVFFSVYGAIAGEILGSFVGTAFTRWQSLREANAKRTHEPVAIQEVIETPLTQMDGGRLVFFGFLFAAVPTFLDRSFVSWQYGSHKAGTYAFLILFVTAANVLSGVIAQSVGPKLLKMEFGGISLGVQARFILRWASFFWLMWSAAILVFYLLSVFGPLDVFMRKYAFDGKMILAVFILGCFQLSVLLDFLLMSRNKEKYIFASGFVFLCAATVVAIIVVTTGASLGCFILMYGLAKFAHLCVQLECVRRTRRDIHKAARSEIA